MRIVDMERPPNRQNLVVYMVGTCFLLTSLRDVIHDLRIKMLRTVSGYAISSPLPYNVLWNNSY